MVDVVMIKIFIFILGVAASSPSSFCQITTYFLKETHPLGLLVMVGREDHRVLVLEVAEDQALEQQRRKLPAACEWIYSSWSSWFQAQPQLMNAFLKLSRPYSHECAKRKVCFVSGPLVILYMTKSRLLCRANGTSTATPDAGE